MSYLFLFFFLSLCFLFSFTFSFHSLEATKGQSLWELFVLITAVSLLCSFDPLLHRSFTPLSHSVPSHLRLSSSLLLHSAFLLLHSSLPLSSLLLRSSLSLLLNSAFSLLHSPLSLCSFSVSTLLRSTTTRLLHSYGTFCHHRLNLGLPRQTFTIARVNGILATRTRILDSTV